MGIRQHDPAAAGKPARNAGKQVGAKSGALIALECLRQLHHAMALEWETAQASRRGNPVRRRN